MNKPYVRPDLAQMARDAAADVEDARRAAVLAAYKKYNISLEKIVQELVLIGFSDIAKYVRIDEGGALQAIPLEQLKPQKTSRAIKKIKETTKISESKDGETFFKESKIEYELYDKLSALRELLSLGDYEPAERNETTHKGVVILEDPFAKFR